AAGGGGGAVDEPPPPLEPLPFEPPDPLPPVGLRLKLAVTVSAALIVTWQAPVPVQPAPFQPAKSESEDGVAVRVTEVPSANSAEQVEPQSIPAGALVTAPVPLPVRATVSVCIATGAAVVKLAMEPLVVPLALLVTRR